MTKPVWQSASLIVVMPLFVSYLMIGLSGNEAQSKTSAADSPNIIVIVADDLGYGDISTYGIKRIPTPHIDALARNGVLFTHGYVAASVCAPSRAGLITGRYPQRFGFEYNSNEGDPTAPASDTAPVEADNFGLAVDEITLGSALQKLGYHTGLVGKWHLGEKDAYYPTNRGFDEFYGFLPGSTAYIDPALPDVVTAKVMIGTIVAEKKQKTNPATRKNIVRSARDQIITGANRQIVNNLDRYLTEDFADQAAAFIGRNKDQPFFLYVGFNAPHTPYQVTKKYYDRFPGIEDQKLRVYTAMISALDDGVGRIMDSLRSAGIAKNTLVVFISDNGCASFKNVCVCAPLRGGKLSHYEGGVRVPFMLSWPGRIKGGKVYRQTVSAFDIFPTAVKAARGEMPSNRVYDGVDLLPYIAGDNKASPHPELVWMRRPQATISDGKWKLWESDDGKVKFLFNLEKDPNESANLYDKRPDKVAEMKRKLEKWRKNMMAPLWSTRPMPPLDVCGVELELPV
jgi:arylsulfatase A-like enzyme